MKAQNIIDEIEWEEERKLRLRKPSWKLSCIPKVKQAVIERIAWNNF